MRLKKFGLGVLVCMGAVACQASYADTLTLVSAGTQSVGNTYIYPYNVSVNGSSSTTEVMCLNYNDHVTIGETWQVTSQAVSTSSSLAFKEDAYLFSLVGQGTYSNADIQFAAWDILDPGVGGDPGLTPTAQQLVSMAQQAASGLTDSFLNQYTIYSPVTTAAAQTTWTDGMPQTFIGGTSVTPEPSSLLLLGTGLGAAGVLMVRRREQDEQNAL